VETSTKERLTGALLVVLALVVAVPELLSGRRPPGSGDLPAQNPEEGAPLQTYNVRLDAPDTAAAATHDVPPAAAAQIAAVPPPVTRETPPEPAAAAAAAPAAAPAKPAARPAPEPVRQTDKTKAAKTAAGKSGAPSAPAAATAWWVQLGSFASQDNAERLARKMRGAGFKIEVSQDRVNGKELYMVRAGPVADRTAATALQARLAAAGQKKSLLVAP
jgi:cell division septation protein DedD